MSIVLPNTGTFSFYSRPTPVPADLRINWRVAVLLIMLSESRFNRASLAKLHLFNQAIRSTSARAKLTRILSKDEPPVNWIVRVEPAFGRAIDFFVGEKFGEWTKASQRAALQLTTSGVRAANAVQEAEDTLAEEKAYFKEIGPSISEAFVTRLLSAGRLV
jgi:hypothetical protein